MCSSRHSHYNSGLFCVSSCKENEIEKRPLSRLPMDAVSELQPAKRDRICIASCLGVLSLNLSLFWTVTGCDRSKGGSRSKCGSMIVILTSDLATPDTMHLCASVLYLDPGYYCSCAHVGHVQYNWYIISTLDSSPARLFLGGHHEPQHARRRIYVSGAEIPDFSLPGT